VLRRDPGESLDRLFIHPSEAAPLGLGPTLEPLGVVDVKAVEEWASVEYDGALKLAIS
jgi:hypothetical protein